MPTAGWGIVNRVNRTQRRRSQAVYIKLLATISTVILLAAVACSSDEPSQETSAGLAPGADEAQPVEPEPVVEQTSQPPVDDSDQAAGQAETPKAGREVGDRILDFTITLEDGTVRTSSDLLSSGRPVFIYFMTTWCPVCRKDLTDLQSVYAEFSEDIEFIVVGQDPTEPLEVLTSYRDDRGQLWPVALAGPGMLADLRITSQAYKLAMDSEGLITYRAGLGGGNAKVWREVIAELVGG